MENFLFPEMTDRAPSRLRKLRARRRKPFVSIIGPGGEGQASEGPLPPLE